ncbi:hypothetical protein HK405_001934 [Cladochytrium tenue]|nr:hypothetical protein HK405_001934 [Cladochytrium tenue]
MDIDRDKPVKAASAPRTNDAVEVTSTIKAAAEFGGADNEGESGAEGGCAKRCCERCRNTLCGASHHLDTYTNGCQERGCASVWVARSSESDHHNT